MHKVIESYHVIFIESKDEHETPFCPGVTQGLDEESIQGESAQPPHNTTPNPIPGVSTIPSTTLITTSITPSATSTPLPLSTLVPIPTPTPTLSTAVPPPVRCSSRNFNPTARLADASGFSRISAVQWATRESIASKARLDEEKKAGCRSRQSSQNGHLSNHAPIPTPDPAQNQQLNDLAEIALSAMNKDR